MASYISPAVRDKFETLSTELQQDILDRNVKLNTVYDLMDVLKTIAQEED